MPLRSCSYFAQMQVQNFHSCNTHHLAPHWNFLSTFLSLHYYTTLEGVLGCPEKPTSSRNYKLFVWAAVFQPKRNKIKKTYKNHQNPLKSYRFLRYSQSFFNFGYKTAAQTYKVNLSGSYCFF